MKTITATWRNGQVLPDDTADWPESCRLRIEPLDKCQSLGIRDDEWSDTPEAIEVWVRWYNSLEPLECTVEEFGAYEAARDEDKQLELKTWEKNSSRIKVPLL